MSSSGAISLLEMAVCMTWPEHIMRLHREIPLHHETGLPIVILLLTLFRKRQIHWCYGIAKTQLRLSYTRKTMQLGNRLCSLQWVIQCDKSINLAWESTRMLFYTWVIGFSTSWSPQSCGNLRLMCCEINVPQNHVQCGIMTNIQYILHSPSSLLHPYVPLTLYIEEPSLYIWSGLVLD